MAKRRSDAGETLVSVLIAALAFAFLSTAALTLYESNGYRCYTEVRP